MTKLRIPLTVEAVAVFKVGDDNSSIANAARRFLDQQQGMERLTAQVLAGHLRSIVGGLTVEEIIGDRNRVAQEVKAASTDEMEKLGLVIDAFQIQEIKDSTGYIENLAAPHAAAVARTPASQPHRRIRPPPRRSRRRTPSRRVSCARPR